MTGKMLTWRAIYRDGTVIEQYDEKRDPIEFSSDIIDRRKVKTFSLCGIKFLSCSSSG